MTSWAGQGGYGGEAGFYAGFDSGAGGGERRRRSEGLSPDAVLSGALGLGFVLLFVGRYFQGNSGALQRVHHVRETYESAVDRWEAILTRKGGLAEAMLNPADTYTFHVITSLVPGQTSTQYTTHLPLEVVRRRVNLLPRHVSTRSYEEIVLKNTDPGFFDRVDQERIRRGKHRTGRVEDWMFEPMRFLMVLHLPGRGVSHQEAIQLPFARRVALPGVTGRSCTRQGGTLEPDGTCARHEVVRSVCMVFEYLGGEFRNAFSGSSVKLYETVSWDSPKARVGCSPADGWTAVQWAPVPAGSHLGAFNPTITVCFTGDPVLDAQAVTSGRLDVPYVFPYSGALSSALYAISLLLIVPAGILLGVRYWGRVARQQRSREELPSGGFNPGF